MKVAYLVAYKNFRDEEYFIPVEVLSKAGIEVDTFSDQKGIAYGSEGGEVIAEPLKSVESSDYEAIILAGGGGALKQLDNEDVYELLLKFNKEEKIIGAICISPVILANAGLLEGKQSTVWSSNMDKKPVKMIEEKGAVYCDEGVVVDGRIVTADGPRTAADFGKELVLNIKKQT